MQSFGSYQAKAHFSQLLDKVERGESVLITRRGKSVARIVPASTQNRRQTKTVIDRMVKRRAGRTHVAKAELTKSLHEGHRF